ncbi:SHOCT domain-containing protein [Protaetiibacter intestinalis]|uniref:Cardiolipin synthase N-terminal domain-containing protein n=1 Tax=Protaetiibacter intestinalis TaxID=2419774 RepID=A0A387B846_9MICO|nr:SHOCT domain-containing protein [Protaetiibacter intestinalis]AYF97365.1 hypothetical protein D7I47_03250 [Protaetiibacter intestinalis]
MDFWQWLGTWFWWIFDTFVWIAGLILLFWVVLDLFRDRKLAGIWKAVWLIFLLFVPVIGSLFYLLVRGRGMGERWAERRGPVPEKDWKPAASATPADDILRAKELLDAGTITQGEFDALKSKALGRQYFG